MKIGRENAEVARVFARDGNRCAICGFDLACVLAAHHKVPRELGGRDTPVNLVTLCANCHRMVHWFSVGDRLEGPDGVKTRQSLSYTAFDQLVELAHVIQSCKAEARDRGHRWTAGQHSHGPMSLAAALELVARRNQQDKEFAAQQRQIVERVFVALGPDLLRRCAVRLVQNGRFLSVNAGNILLFRVPALPDGGKEQIGDFFIIWTRATKLGSLSASEWRQISRPEPDN